VHRAHPTAAVALKPERQIQVALPYRDVRPLEGARRLATGGSDALGDGRQVPLVDVGQALHLEPRLEDDVERLADHELAIHQGAHLALQAEPQLELVDGRLALPARYKQGADQSAE
jgi:hypothetical protein